MSPRLVALSFFDDAVAPEEKRKMKDVYLASVAKDQRKKKEVLTRASSIRTSDTLASFITTDTKEFFEIINISTDFMSKNESEWPAEESYQTGKKRSASLQVLNDVAERGVKLIADFNDKGTRDATQQGFMLQVIESHRKRFPKKWYSISYNF